ncbi:LamG-like jellyroll fold domain-containing protein [Priestia megaterium]
MTISNSAYIQLPKNNYKLTETIERLQKQISTGSRINSANDDAAGLSLSERLKSQVNSYTTGIQNLTDAKSATELVKTTYQETANTLRQMKDLVTKYQDSATSIEEKNNIQQQLLLLQGDIQNQFKNLKYENKKITTDSVKGKLDLSEYEDAIRMADNSALKMSSSSITMEAKVNLTSYAPGTTLDDRSLVLGKYGNYYLTINSTGSVGIYKYGTSSSGYRESVGKVGLGQDTTISGVFDGNTAKIYINGKLDSTFTLPGSGYEDREADLTIGFENSPKFKRQFTGTIDDIRIYDKALSDTEVSNNYKGTVTRDHLQGEWLFNDGDLNSVVYDTSGNNSFGTFSGHAKVITDSDANMNFSTGEGNMKIGFSTLTLSKLGIADLSQIQSNTSDKLDRALDLISSEIAKTEAFTHSINSRIESNQKLIEKYQTSVDDIRSANTQEVSSQLTKLQMQQGTVSDLLESIQKFNKNTISMLVSPLDISKY